MFEQKMVRETSIDCYSEIIEEGLVGDMQKIVYDKLLEKDDLTDQEIARELVFKDPNKVRPRRKELLDLRLILDNGIRRCSVTQRKAHSWVINPKPNIVLIRRLKNIIKRKCKHCGGQGYIIEIPIKPKVKDV